MAAAAAEEEKEEEQAAAGLPSSRAAAAAAAPRLLRAPAGAGPPASLPRAPVFFVVAGSPPPDPAAGAALQRHIIKPGLAGNVAGSQQEDVRSGVPAGERSDPVGRPALLRLGSDGERANSTERWTALEIQLRPPAKPGPRRWRQARRGHGHGHRTGTRGPGSGADSTGREEKTNNRPTRADRLAWMPSASQTEKSEEMGEQTEVRCLSIAAPEDFDPCTRITPGRGFSRWFGIVPKLSLPHTKENLPPLS